MRGQTFLGACALVLVAATARGAVDDKVSRTFPATAAGEVRVRTTIGAVTVEAWARPEIAVEIARRVPQPPDQDRLPVVIDIVEGVLRIEAVQAADGRDAALRADVSVRLPAATVVGLIEVFEGSVSISGLSGSVSSVVERGDIEARGLAGSVRLETSSGGIRLDGMTLKPGGLLRCRTFNGDIAVTLAERPLDARILVLTLNGTIESSIPLTQRTGFGPRFGEGVLGKGETLLSLDAVRGRIQLRAP